MAVAHERIERLQRLLEWREAVPFVQLVEVNMVDAEALQAGVAGGDQMVARQPYLVRSLAHAEPSLGRDQRAVAATAQDFAQDLLRGAGRIDVGRIEQIDPGIEAHVDLPRRARDIGVAGLGEIATAAEGHGAHRQG